MSLTDLSVTDIDTMFSTAQLRNMPQICICIVLGLCIVVCLLSVSVSLYIPVENDNVEQKVCVCIGIGIVVGVCTLCAYPLIKGSKDTIVLIYRSTLPGGGDQNNNRNTISRIN